MQVLALDHANVRTNKLAEMVAWYEEILGLKSGPRPPFNIGGAWLYAGEYPIVHLVEVGTEPASIEPKIEHFAVRATGMQGLVDRLRAREIPFSMDRVPDFPIVQVNLCDCDGNHIHVDFALSEYEALSDSD